MVPRVIAVFRHFDYLLFLLENPVLVFGALLTKIGHQPIMMRYFIGHMAISNTWILRRKSGFTVKYIEKSAA